MKDAVATMGDILPDDAGGRDAVHVAVFSAISSETLAPGQRISILTKVSEQDTMVSSIGDYVAIVDPFIEGHVPAGERFWAYLFPRTITALSHQWSHPSFETTDSSYSPPSKQLESEQWLRKWFNENDCPSFDIAIEALENIIDGHNDSWDEEYLHFDGYDAHADIPDELWDHVEVYFGRPVKGAKPKYFSCSC